MFSVGHEEDLVVIDLCGRRRDVLMSCGEAERFAVALEKNAALAELGDPALVRGEPWEAKVESYDGAVAVRFYPPTVGAPERVRMPAAVARAMAARVRFKAQQAAYRMRFVFK